MDVEHLTPGSEEGPRPAGRQSEGASPEVSRPLSRVRVVDMTTGQMAANGRLLAELGSDVVHVSVVSAAPAWQSAVATASTGSSKRVWTVDVDDPAAVNDLIGLVDEADIVIENSEPESALRRLVDSLKLHEASARVIVSISPFGRIGPYADWQATGAILQAMSGVLANSGFPGRAPLLPPADLALASAVPHIASYILLALLNRLQSGTGDYLDISLLDATVSALDPVYGMGGSAGAGLAPSDAPRGRIDARYQYPIFPCRDGFVRLCVLKPGQWRGMFTWMGSPPEFADPAFDTLRIRFASSDLTTAMANFVADKTREDLEEGGERHGVPLAGVRSLAEALESPQVIARNAITWLPVDGSGLLPFPNGVMEVDGIRMSPSPAEAVKGGGAVRWRDVALPLLQRPLDPRGPLAGLRVLDLGVIVAGGELGRVLADMGADVVKVESARNPDGSRQTRDGSPMSRSFAAGNRNKRSLAIDLRNATGNALFLDLARDADVMLSNFKPGTLEGLGLGADTLAAVNPRLIAVESSAFGPTGPWRARLGYGPLIRSAMGLSLRWCYPGEPGSFSDTVTVYPDHAAARTGTVAVLALLVRRLGSGNGGRAAIAQSEVILNGIATDIARLGLGESYETIDESAWLRGVFACAGDDEWCAIDVRDERDWLALCGVIGIPHLVPGRAAEEELACWTGSRSSEVVQHSLQAAGVPAARMLRAADLLDHPYFLQRRLFRGVNHPQFATPLTHEADIIRSKGLPTPPERTAPMLGEHSRAVLAEWLGLPDDFIAALVDRGIVQDFDQSPTKPLK